MDKNDANLLLSLSDDLIARIVQDLGGRDVRRVCPRLAAVFDAHNRRMVLQKDRSSEYPGDSKLLALASSVTDLTVKSSFPRFRLARILEAVAPRLTSLCMHGCANRVVPPLTPFQALQRLDLRSTHVDVARLSSIARSLRHLDIGYNTNLIGKMRMVGEALGRLTELESLDLESVHMGCEGVEALAGNLPASLLRLNLSYNDVDEDAGADALARALRGLPKLQELDLANFCAMNRSLAESLAHLTDMRKLILSSNHGIGSTAEHLAASFVEMPRLRDLDLEDNSLDAGAIETLLLEKGSRLTSLRRLKLGFNYRLEDEFREKLHAVFPDAAIDIELQ